MLITAPVQIESLHRDKQLKAAQMSAIQQREETLRSRVLAYFDREMMRIPMNNPTLSDLIQLLIESPRVHVARSHASLPAEQSHDRFDYGHSSSQRDASRRSHHFDTGAPSRDRLGEPRQLRDYHVNVSHEGSLHRRSTSPKLSRDDSVRGSTRESGHGLNQSRSSSSQPRSGSNSRGHHSDHDIISSMAEREARALSSRAPQSYDHFETGRSYEKDPLPADNRALSSSQGPSAAAQALQDRIRKAQQTFRAMRDSSKNQ